MSISSFFEVKESSHDEKKREFKEHMDFLKALSVQEYTLYKKWIEVQDYKPRMDAALDVRSKVWVPNDLEDVEGTLAEIEAMEPKIKPVENEIEEEIWLMLRVFSHTMEFNQSPGRFMKLLIYTDVETENQFIGFGTERKYLGAVSLSSDVISLGARDEYIGWTKEDREGGKLAHTTIASCIMSTQPFGYNFLGGKLVASLVASDVVRDAWKEKYGNQLVGVTTTSLYGSYSMYNGIKYWKKVGKSQGKILLAPDSSFYKDWHQWLKQHDVARYNKITDSGTTAGPATGIKQNILYDIFRHVGIKNADYQHGFQRGVYFAQMFENGNEFLQGKIDEDELELKDKFKSGVEGVVEWWKPKAKRRYKSLHEQGRLKPDILYYMDLIGLSWEEAKGRYMTEVGR